MSSVAQHLAFAPPVPAGMARSLSLAVFVHLLLLLALTWGVNWKNRSIDLTVEAELWSALPQQAAPKPIEVQPAPVPVVPVEAPPKPVLKDPQIAIERDKRREAQKKLEAEQAKKLELQKRELAEKREKLLAKERALQQQRKELTEKQRSEELQAKRQESERADNIRRMLGQASNATGSAERSAGPSASYAGRIRARIKPNIVYGDDKPGNPVAEVELRTAPDGTIISRKLLKSSGVSAWDDAVLKAIDKTETLPRDVDGQVPPLMVLIFRPKE